MARLFKFVWLVGGCLLMAACGSDDDAGSVEIVFDGSDCEYRGSDRLEAGSTDFSFANDSDIVATAAVLLITDDKTYADVEELSRSDPDWNGDEEWADLVSPVGGVASGNSYDWMTELTAGSHYVVCIGGNLETFFYGGGFTVEP